MPVSRGTNPDGARPEDLAEWQARRFPARRPRPTPYLDELPDDLLADVEETRRILDQIRARD